MSPEIASDIKNNFDKPDTVSPNVTKLDKDEWRSHGETRVVRKHSWCFYVINGRRSAAS